MEARSTGDKRSSAAGSMVRRVSAGYSGYSRWKCLKMLDYPCNLPEAFRASVTPFWLPESPHDPPKINVEGGYAI